MAGLRPMTAYAVIALALERGWIRPSNSPLARIVSARALKRIAELAASELIADKLPFTPSRLHAAPLASRVVSGAICGATIHNGRIRILATGALVGGIAAITAAFAAYHARRKLSLHLPGFAVALLEDCLALGGGFAIAALAATPNED